MSAMPRLTPAEEHAILVALASALAGEVLDGYDGEENEVEERTIRRRMEHAQRKLWDRAERRERASR